MMQVKVKAPTVWTGDKYITVSPNHWAMTCSLCDKLGSLLSIEFSENKVFSIPVVWDFPL